MKKWLALTLLLFCIPALVWGWGTVIISGSVSTQSPTYLFQETFDTDPGYDLSGWTEKNDPDEDSTTIVRSGQSLHAANSSGVEKSAKYNEGTLRDNVHGTFYIYVDSVTLPNNGDDGYVFRTTDGAGTTNGILLMFRNNAGTVKCRVRAGENYSEYAILDLDEWVKVDFDYNRNASSSITITSSSNPGGTVLTVTAPDYGVQYYYFGGVMNWDSDEMYDLYFDDITVYDN